MVDYVERDLFVMHPHKYAYLISAKMTQKEMMILTKLLSATVRCGQWIMPLTFDVQDYEDADTYYGGTDPVSFPKLLLFELQNAVTEIEPFYRYNMVPEIDGLAEVFTDDYQKMFSADQKLYAQLYHHTFDLLKIEEQDRYKLLNITVYCHAVPVDDMFAVVRSSSQIHILLGKFGEKAEFARAVLNLRRTKAHDINCVHKLSSSVPADLKIIQASYGWSNDQPLNNPFIAKWHGHTIDPSDDSKSAKESDCYNGDEENPEQVEEQEEKENEDNDDDLIEDSSDIDLIEDSICDDDCDEEKPKVTDADYSYQPQSGDLVIDCSSNNLDDIIEHF